MTLRAANLTRHSLLAASLESADSLWARFLGLMGRSGLAGDAGLWLPGGNGIHMMFMRFAIDCVFVGDPSPVDGTRAVVAIRRALPPWRGVVWYVRGAHGTLELPVGTIDRTETAVGDRIRLERADHPR
ncbi:MAG: uncharacterized protein QOF11_173 [Chloroflexota bacterium]|jgi:uncharacterized membrane protein (UPF0127 family)|nr:uncharacterized protein [Chloroflexota bacterium]